MNDGVLDRYETINMKQPDQDNKLFGNFLIDFLNKILPRITYELQTAHENKVLEMLMNT